MAILSTRARGDLLDAAWEVAAHYRAHDAYGSEARARQALARRRPGHTLRQYHDAFQKGLALYDVAVELVARDAAELWQQWQKLDRASKSWTDFDGQVHELRQRCPGFRTTTYYATLNWVFFWHHLK